MNRFIVLSVAALVMLIITSSCATAPSEPTPSEPSQSGSPENTVTHTDVVQRKEPYTGNHGITTTRVMPQPGDKGILVSVNLLQLTQDDLILESDVIVIGKVVDILPSQERCISPSG